MTESATRTTQPLQVTTRIATKNAPHASSVVRSFLFLWRRAGSVGAGQGHAAGRGVGRGVGLADGDGATRVGAAVGAFDIKNIQVGEKVPADGAPEPAGAGVGVFVHASGQASDAYVPSSPLTPLVPAA